MPLRFEFVDLRPPSRKPVRRQTNEERSLCMRTVQERVGQRSEIDRHGWTDASS